MDCYGSLILFAIAVVGTAYYFLNRIYSYWEDRGMVSVKGTFPYGVLQGLGKIYHMIDITTRYYQQFKNKTGIVGLYFFIRPVALVLDLDLIKNILVKDFQYFMDRGVYMNEADEPLSGHLFSMEGSKWKSLRAKLTPTFTSGKMKMMFPTIVAVGQQFEAYMRSNIAKNSEIEMKDVLARFTTDVIGNCAFGLECNSMKDPDAQFRRMGQMIFEKPRNGLLKVFFMQNFRSLAKMMHMKVFRDEVNDFFMNAVVENIKYREENNIQRNDFMDLLIKLKNTGNVDGGTSGEKTEISINEIAAQAFVFFLAGFETSSTAMTYALYELSQNREVQEKARQSVRAVLEKHNGVWSYEAVLDMTYIDQCINESLRMYPPVANLNRILNANYKVPNTDIILEKGTSVMIPVYSIQHDPEHYPDPEVYDPDRFSQEESSKRNPFAFLPFGEGPRVCIGLRFGMMQARIGLAILLNNFDFSSCSKSIVPLVLSKQSGILAPAGGLHLKVVQLK